MRKVIISGNLTANARKIDTEKGGFLTFILACQERYGDKRTTEYIECKTGAVGAEKYLTKRKGITVVGTFSHKEYTSKTGETRKILSVSIWEMALDTTTSAATAHPTVKNNENPPVKAQVAPVVNEPIDDAEIVDALPF